MPAAELPVARAGRSFASGPARLVLAVLLIEVLVFSISTLGWSCPWPLFSVPMPPDEIDFDRTTARPRS